MRSSPPTRSSSATAPSSHTRPTLVGDPQVRHRGTIGGSVAHADPASTSPPSFSPSTPTSSRGPRRRADDRRVGVLHGPFETALAPREVLTEIRVPKVERGVYLKHARRAQDWATVGVAAAVVGATRRWRWRAWADAGPCPCRRGGAGERGRPGRRVRPRRRGRRAAERRERQRGLSRAPCAGLRPARARAALGPPASGSTRVRDAFREELGVLSEVARDEQVVVGAGSSARRGAPSPV